MSVRIEEEPLEWLAEHAQISIAFEVRSKLAVSLRAGGLGGIVLDEQPVVPPYTKDYDAPKGAGPTWWPTRFDTSQWGLLAAHDANRRVGGAVVAFGSGDVLLLDGRTDLAAIWDLRIVADRRGGGIASMLFNAAEAWARERGCRQLKVETQNINVPASRFYAHMGCALGAINRFAYPDHPDETQLLWFKDL
jgi:ribosomal protein S18 acetylase RimI-like enzyme